MLLFHTSHALQTRLENGQFQNIACLLVQHQFAGVDRHVQLVLSDTHLQFRLHRLHIDVQSLKHFLYRSFLHAHES